MLGDGGNNSDNDNKDKDNKKKEDDTKSTDSSGSGGVRNKPTPAVNEAASVPLEVPITESQLEIQMPADSADNAQVHVPHRETVRLFLKRARAAYGRTALCLSGGGMMANYHYGVIRALLEEDCLPNIISGTSAGSVIGSLICTRTPEELKRDLDPVVLQPKQGCFTRSWAERIKSAYLTGNMFDGNEWIDMISWFCNGDMTFEEAYRKTGRVLCISVSATSKKAPPVLLNYISAPHVVIASAIIASAAVPGFIKPVRLRIKDPATGKVHVPSEKEGEAYWDGSIQQDIPLSGLSEMLNCQFFVASQCNPHLAPFFFNVKGDVGNPSRWSNNSGSGAGGNMDSWRGGFLLGALEMYVKNDMRAKMRFLDDVEAAVGFMSTMFTQSAYGGHTTIVPKIKLPYFFKVFTNPTVEDMEEYFQVGLTCTYPHVQMIKVQYAIARALDDCLVYLDEDGTGTENGINIHSEVSFEEPQHSYDENNTNEDEPSSSAPAKTFVRKGLSMSEKARNSYVAKEGGTNVSELPL
jgi:predicted acylesterase/phospholipase RssA